MLAVEDLPLRDTEFLRHCQHHVERNRHRAMHVPALAEAPASLTILTATLRRILNVALNVLVGVHEQLAVLLVVSLPMCPIKDRGCTFDAASHQGVSSST
jgi:hypothetical protein